MGTSYCCNKQAPASGQFKNSMSRKKTMAGPERKEEDEDLKQVAHLRKVKLDQQKKTQKEIVEFYGDNADSQHQVIQ